MGRYERKIFLDKLVELRDGYKSTTHEATSLTIDGAIDYTIGLFDATDRLEAILADETAEASTSDQAA